MLRRALDPAELEGAALEAWYGRTPDEIEAERERRRQEEYDAFYGGLSNSSVEGDALREGGPPSWEEARLDRPARPAVPVPRGVPVGPPVDARPGAPNGSFFDRPSVLGGYFTNLPPPLNYVEPQFGGWVQLGDGKLVRAEEVERIAAEQRRRAGRAPDIDPPAHVQSANRFQDGLIPKASEIAKDRRERDPTCHPNGGWERYPGYEQYPAATQRYEAQVTRAPGLDYVVRNPGEKAVRFDGCTVWSPQHELLEAKGPGYFGLLENARRWQFEPRVREKAARQARRQDRARRGRDVEWHYAEPGAQTFFDGVVEGYPGMTAVYTPPR